MHFRIGSNIFSLHFWFWIINPNSRHCKILGIHESTAIFFGSFTCFRPGCLHQYSYVCVQLFGEIDLVLGLSLVYSTIATQSFQSGSFRLRSLIANRPTLSLSVCFRFVFTFFISDPKPPNRFRCFPFYRHLLLFCAAIGGCFVAHILS